MTKNKEWIRKRVKKRALQEKRFDFVPNKQQVIYGAFLDLGKRKCDRDLIIARMIASYYGEDI